MPPSDISQATADFDTLGGRLVRARDAAGLSSTDVARHIGVKRATIDAWESDRSEPRSNRLSMLAGLLGVSPTWLLFGRGSAPAEEGIASEIKLIHGQLDQLRDLHERTGQTIKTIEDALMRLEGKN